VGAFEDRSGVRRLWATHSAKKGKGNPFAVEAKHLSYQCEKENIYLTKVKKPGGVNFNISERLNVYPRRNDGKNKLGRAGRCPPVPVKGSMREIPEQKTYSVS